MADSTEFLELVLPANGEMADSWDEAVNGNFEAIDDHAKELHADLVGSSGDTGNLAGNTTSLLARISNGLDEDGYVKLSSAPDFLVLQSSRLYGVDADSDPIRRIINRFDKVEKEVVALRQETSDTRDGTHLGQSALGGVAQFCKTYKKLGTGVQSYIRGFRPDCVIDGFTLGSGTSQSPGHMTSSVDGELQIFTNSGTNPVIYNIDGYLFKISKDLKMTQVSGSPSTKYYVIASRNASDYNGSIAPFFYYSMYNGNDIGGNYALNLRVIPTNPSLRADAASATDPTGEVTDPALNKLTSTGASFSSYGVANGDVLVISSPAALSGEYIVSSASSEDTLTIHGKFRSTSASVTFHIERRTMPCILYTTMPLAGHLTIGHFMTNVSGLLDPATVKPYQYQGTYDSGWLGISTDGLGFPFTLSHNIGVVPNHITVMVKAGVGATSIDFNPHLNKTVVTNVTGPVTEVLKVPALEITSTNTLVSIGSTNATRASDHIIYTTKAGVNILDNTSVPEEAFFRVIASR